MEASTILRNSADFAKHYASGDKPAEFTLADYFRGIANLRLTPTVKNALSTGVDTAGGFAVPGVLMPGILDALVPESALLKAGVGIVPLAEGAKTFTQAVTAGIPTAAWRNESATVATSDPAFNAVVITPRSLAFQFKISRELLADGAGVDAALRRAIAQSFAKELDRVGLRGSGTAPEPRGLLNTILVQKVSHGTNGAFINSWASLLNGVENAWNLNGPTPTAAIMCPSSLIALEGLTDVMGQHIARPELLRGMKLIQTSQVPDNLVVGTSPNCSEIYIGDFSTMFLAMRESVSIQMLSELYAATGEIGFACHVRADVVVPYPATFGVLTGLHK
jgi:HK97 family phage major capsid protein